MFAAICPFFLFLMSYLFILFVAEWDPPSKAKKKTCAIKILLKMSLKNVYELNLQYPVAD